MDNTEPQNMDSDSRLTDMPSLQQVCDACRVKIMLPSRTGATLFVAEHIDHNFSTGLRIEPQQFPSPRLSRDYKIVTYPEPEMPIE